MSSVTLKRTTAKSLDMPVVSRFTGGLLRYAVLVSVGVLFVLPFILAFLGGFKTDTEIFDFPPRILPDGWTGKHFFSEDESAAYREAGQILGQSALTADLGYALSQGSWPDLAAAANAAQALADEISSANLSAADRLALADVFEQAAVPLSAYNPALVGKFNAAVQALKTNDPTLAAVFKQITITIKDANKNGPFYSLSNLFSKDTIAVPAGSINIKANGTVQNGFSVALESRKGWTVRDQYGISNWINVFRAGQCENGWLGNYCFPYWLFNSVFLAAVNVMTRVFLASLAGYAFARMEFPGKKMVFTFMLATLMLPGAVTLIPGYVLIADLGWVGTFWSLIIPSAVEVFGIFLMSQFLKAVPKDLEEAARVDGATQWQIVSRVVLPLARPALVTLAIISFQGSWNAFQGPLLYLRGDPSVFTLPVGLQYFQQQFRQQWNLTLIGSMFNAFPVLIIFLIFNRYFIEGVSYSGVKG
jgi:multiple sugar transport system permease protein